MYLHLKDKHIINKRDIVGIFDLETSTLSKDTKNYLSYQQKQNKVVTVTNDIPKSFVITKKNTVITQVSTKSLLSKCEIRRKTI